MFGVLWLILGLASWLFFIVESFASRLFVPFFFESGFPVYRSTIITDVYDLSFPVNQTILKAQGKYRFVDKDKVYFFSHPKFFRISTPFLFKAVGILNKNKIEIRAKIPLGTTLFILFFIIGSISLFIFFGLFACVVGFFMFLISIPLEEKRMRNMVAELDEIVRAL